MQGKVRALDGYYLIDSDGFLSVSTWQSVVDKYQPGKNISNLSSSDYQKFLTTINTVPFVIVSDKAETYLTNRFYCYYYHAYNVSDVCLAVNLSGYVVPYDYKKKTFMQSLGYYGSDYSLNPRSAGYASAFSVSHFLHKGEGNVLAVYGTPLKIFYSKTDADKYYSKGQSYVPKLPSTNLTIPLGYANGTLNLPDFNINLDSLIGKAEADIQADIDNQFKLYLDKLAEININPSQPTNPTPTPSGGGSGGDFGDGTTPTPAPDFTDGLKDTNDYLKQILEKVTSILQIDTEFSKSFETVSQNLCKYLESNNEKLDQIITAINALSNGKTEDEVNGCKYDFTELSKSLTSLWNDSDQKFDQMIKLLEENNKYQEKIIGDLNDIKAILIAQTVLDAFQNRSQETANKAKEKFPTSIPWDIAMIVNTFSAEPEPIKFELPIKVNSLNINETITVDLSSGEWEKLGKLCRYMLSVLFILFLIQLSRKLFSNGGDE